VTRILNAIVYNWPLKLAAIALATILYGGLIVTQNAQTRGVSIPIEVLRDSQPADTILIGELGSVTEIRYLVSDSDVAITSSNFTATVDLSQLRPGPQAQSVRVVVQSADPRIDVLSATPAFVSVHLETVDEKDVSVVVAPGQVPTGLSIDQPTQSIRTAKVRGAQSDIARVTSVRAVVQVDASGISIDRDIPLTPVDQLGEVVRGVDVVPATVHVTMNVFEDRSTATVRIVPVVTGAPAPGFEVTAVSTSLPVLTIKGDAVDLKDVPTAQTKPVSVDGRSEDFDLSVGFDLPATVTPVTAEAVIVHVTIRPLSESRSFSAGIVLTGARGDRTYSLSTGQAIVTIGGSPADLDRLTGSTIALTADVAGLDVGSHEVKLTIVLQAGLNLVAISPSTVVVTVAPSGTAASGSPAAPSGGP
jgi:YbbR domain-containing protein